jgi:site-specific recombinase XerD
MKSINIIDKVIPKSELYNFRIISRNTYMLTNNDIENILGILKKMGETDEFCRLSYYVVITELLFAFRVQSATEIKLDSFETDLREFGRVIITCPANKKRNAFTSAPIQSNLDRTLLLELIEYLNERKQFLFENKIKIDKNTPLFDPKIFYLRKHNKVLTQIFDFLEIQVPKITESEEEFLFLENNGEEHLINYPTINHAFRHYAANRWLSLGVNIHLIRDYLNHKQVTTTINNYLHGIHLQVFEKFNQIDRNNLYEFKLKKKTILALIGLNNSAHNQLSKIISDYEILNNTIFKYQIDDINLLCSYLLNMEFSALQKGCLEGLTYSGRIYIQYN